ncbi:hypothetical protein HR45_04525 [Shewanella mangrovi]|uniref:Uncharacterized protein n=1 Tax=Shewanella mangrovi TaxID=1515746 RepID=A0A094LU18_9GAMM|nr:hypothetical protein [Shewanella mangrovi]KFZ38693.1 hypothetical protein HR45_04525 [Shewanella mangrovi]
MGNKDNQSVINTSRKFIGWSLATIGALAVITICAVTAYQAFWMPSEFSISGAGDITTTTHGQGIQTLFSAQLPLAVFLIISAIGLRFVSQSKKPH